MPIGPQAKTGELEPTTYIGQLFQRDREAAKAHLMQALRDAYGSVITAAGILGISRPHLHYLLRRLDLRDEPRKIRDQLRARFRVPLDEEETHPLCIEAKANPEAVRDRLLSAFFAAKFDRVQASQDLGCDEETFCRAAKIVGITERVSAYMAQAKAAGVIAAKSKKRRRGAL